MGKSKEDILIEFDLDISVYVPCPESNLAKLKRLTEDVIPDPDSNLAKLKRMVEGE